jgi:CheY-like chemotaxis protein
MNGMGKKILLADDSITIQKVIELTFSDEDFDVVTVGNGRLALERLPEVRPDIVLCDIIMPEKDGYEVCEQIKSNPSTGHIPVLLLTGAFEPFDQERAARAGYDGSLAKPFEPETLIAKVKDLLAKAPRPLAPPPLPTGPMPAAVAPGFVTAPAGPPVAATGASTARTMAPGSANAPSSFIPDEPFSGLDEGAFEVEPTPRAAAAPPAAAPQLASISAEEADTLSVPPDAGAEDGASTVMYRSAEMPWKAGAAAPAAAVPQAAPSPLVADASEAGAEPAVFEAVLEEDLDFGPGDYASPARTSASGGTDISEAFSANAGTLPPVAEVEEGTSGPFAALVRGEAEGPIERTAASTAEFPRSTAVEEELLEPEPFPPAEPPRRPIFEEPPAREPVRHAAQPAEPPRMRTLLEPTAAPAPVRAPEPFVAPPRPPAARTAEPPPPPAPPRVSPVQGVRSSEPASAPVRAAATVEPPKVAAERPARTLLDASPARPQPPVKVEPRPRPEAHTAPAPSAPRVAEASFGEVVVPAEDPARPSEAAAVSVPVEMVEKIAQRVIAQISDKIVREVAWEVIPDLAEAVIKREIERLKAELAKI